MFLWSTDAVAETPILWPTDANSQLIEKDSHAGQHWRQNGKWQQRMRWSDGTTVSMDRSVNNLSEKVGDRGTCCAAVCRVANCQIGLSNWTTITTEIVKAFSLFLSLINIVTPAKAGNMDSIPASGRSPGEENGNPLQHSCLENSMDREAWQTTIHWVAKYLYMASWLNNNTSEIFILNDLGSSCQYIKFSSLIKLGSCNLLYIFTDVLVIISKGVCRCFPKEVDLS